MTQQPRRYHSPRRERLAVQTREEILAAARELFIAHGYAQVTMPEIAQATGVAVKTVYSSVGTKSDVLHAVLLTDLGNSTLAETSEKVSRSTDLPTILGAIAAGVRSDTERFRPTIDVMLASSASDERARQLWEQTLTLYRGALRDCAEHLVDHRLVATDLDIDTVADHLWYCFGLAAWQTLVVDCGWSYTATERQLARTAELLLTDDPGRC